jgi:hypothetical protein
MTFAALLLALALAVRGAATPSAARPKTVTCAFSHPSYSGYCRETKEVPKGGTPERVCEDILKCLNDVRCIETFCQATTIRGGWRLESVTVEGGEK